MPPPRILFVYQYLTLGGVEIVIHTRLKEMARLGVPSKALFFYDLGGRSIFQDLKDQIVVTSNPDEQRELLDEFSPEFVVTFDSPQIIPVAKAVNPDCRIIYEAHTIYPRNFRPLRDKDLMGQCAAIFVPSEHQRVRRFETSHLPVFVVPNALKEEFFQDSEAEGRRPEQPIVVWVGRIDDRKNWRGFISVAFEIRTAANPEFWMVGGARALPEAQRQLWRAISKKGLEEELRWFPAIQHDKMPGLLRHVSRSGGCLLSTSRTESFGIAVLEAMACGCPVVVPEVGALVDLVKDGTTGRIYAPGSNAGAARSTLDLLSHPADARRMAKQAEEFARQFSPKESTRHFLECVENLDLQSTINGAGTPSGLRTSGKTPQDLEFEQAVIDHFRSGTNLDVKTPAWEAAVKSWIRYALETNARGQELSRRLEPFLSARWGKQYSWRGRKVLDVGCAYGGTLKTYVRLGAEVVGIDVNSDFLELAKLNLRDEAPGKITLRCGSIETIDPARLGQFDLIIIDNALEHVDNPEAVARILADLLLPDGALYTAVPNPFAPPQVTADPHFGVFGITLLEREIAVRYFEEIRPLWTYEVGQYPNLEDLLLWYSDSGLSVQFIDLDSSIPSEPAARDARIAELTRNVDGIQNALEAALRGSSLSGGTRLALKRAVDDYRHEYHSDLARLGKGRALAKREFLEWYSPLVWHVLAMRMSKDGKISRPNTIRTPRGDG
jgi:glycosyltransferase involved in cell wall biosynthesis/2-polyprenyl-3-methyl-5-hydroxy-6-metoxy-1,4-benzoquinol methylase